VEASGLADSVGLARTACCLDVLMSKVAQSVGPLLAVIGLVLGAKPTCQHRSNDAFDPQRTSRRYPAGRIQGPDTKLGTIDEMN
jgi:hypothetical protein